MIAPDSITAQRSCLLESHFICDPYDPTQRTDYSSSSVHPWSGLTLHYQTQHLHDISYHVTAPKFSCQHHYYGMICRQIWTFIFLLYVLLSALYSSVGFGKCCLNYSFVQKLYSYSLFPELFYISEAKNSCSVSGEWKQSNKCTFWEAVSCFAVVFILSLSRICYFDSRYFRFLWPWTVYFDSVHHEKNFFSLSLLFVGSSFLNGEKRKKLLHSQGQRRSLCCGEVARFRFSHFHCEDLTVSGFLQLLG